MLNLKSFTALVTIIAHELGGKLNMEFANENHFYAKIASPTLPIALWAKNDKLTVKVDWPEWTSETGSRNIYNYDSVKGMLSQDEINATVTEIGCSVNKDTAKIVQSIRRRLFPNAQVAYACALKRCKDNEGYYNGQQLLIRSLVKQFNVEMPRHGGETLYFKEFDLQVNTADSVTFHRLSVNANVAKKIIALIQSEKE